MANQTILWKRVDQPGHESARIFLKNSDWHLVGTAVFLHERMACRLDYQIECDHNWRTRHTRVTGWVGESAISADIRVDSLHRWHLNGSECPQVKGCTDIDLNFSPSTNLLPIRRMNLAIGEEISVQAAWLRFPSFELELLPQIYRRVDQTTFQYESAGGKFKTELQVNEDGFVIDYPGIWLEEN
jgi:hypothetical protein